MIISKINTKKSKISILLLGMFLYGVIEPPIAYALTSGPTTPEASSFEPIDTTDMVNPMTGSFTYNVPIVEVPGPGGGYPLSLSYHAGISPDLESSWAGLGWNINPGAINRHVAGFPDDFKDVPMKRRDYWAGGTTTTLGITVGYANMVTAGLTFSSDTYQGFGIGANVGMGMDLGGVGSVGLDVGISPYGDFNGAAGMALNLGVAQVGAGVSLNGSSGTVEPYKSLSLGYSMGTSSNNSKQSLRIGGSISLINNNNAGNLSTDSKGITLPVIFPNGLSLSLSFRKTRYWSDETDETLARGTLYSLRPGVDFNKGSNANDNYLGGRSGDLYRLLDPKRENVSEKRYFPHSQLGGTFPEYDHYTVLAQGIGGSIKPYLFQRQLFGQVIDRPNNYSSRSSPVYENTYDPGVGFRFENDFSNAYLQSLDNFTLEPSTYYLDKFPFGAPTGHEGKNNNFLPGSRHIQYYTNESIGNGAAKKDGFMDVSNFTIGFTRLPANSLPSREGKHQIGGFSITNSSGVTYHYALPAYSFDELSYSKSNSENRFSYSERKEPYAYTWHLTAVTGPDYVDRNDNGKADAGDWGYWVAFDYGKWASDYRWRNPGLTDHKDLDSDVNFFSRGHKEIYYLNAIRTETHFALFEKDIRIDGKSASAAAFASMEASGSFDNTSFPLLKLNKIHLFDIKHLNLFSVSARPNLANSNPQINEGFSKVFDTSDIDYSHEGRAAFESKSLRSVQLEHDYSLMKNTPNSFPLGGAGSKQGKLTLKSIAFKGKQGVQMIPSTKFDYSAQEGLTDVNYRSPTEFNTGDQFEIGDMIETSDGRYAGVITKVVVSRRTASKTYHLTNGTLSGTTTDLLSVRKTKNPDYRENASDIWGYYKSDFNSDLHSLNTNLARTVTDISKKSVDAWCLRRITTPLGANIEINYESGSYSKDVLGEHPTVVVNSATMLSAPGRFRFNINSGIEHFLGSENSGATYSIGNTIQGVFLIKEVFPVSYHRSVDTRVDGPTMVLENVSESDKYIDVSFRGGEAASVILTGNIIVNKPKVIYGGGIRTKSISIVKWDGSREQTDYRYDDLRGNSTGVTAYSPYYLDADLVNSHINVQNEQHIDARNKYRENLYRNRNELINLNREFPPPSVIYASVTIANSAIQKNGDFKKKGKTKYEFRPFEKAMLQYSELNVDLNAGKRRDHSYYNKMIENYTSNIGDLLSVETYDGDDRLISKIENYYIYDKAKKKLLGIKYFSDSQYKEDLRKFNNQGVLIERFGDYRYAQGFKKQKWILNEFMGIMSSKAIYPSVLLRSSTFDYLTNQNTENRNISYDFLSGSVTKSITKDNLGNNYLTEQIPAYRKYPRMGHKLSNTQNKHMLSQLAGTYFYKADHQDNPLSLLSASTTVWDNTVKVLTPDGEESEQRNYFTGEVWRKRANFVFTPNSLAYPNGAPVSMGDFQWLSLTDSYDYSDMWSLLNGVTLYGVNSEVLESRDVNKSYSSTRYGYNDKKVVLSSQGAKYYESAYSGAEDEEINRSHHNRGFVLRGNATVIDSGTIPAHTGHKLLKLDSDQDGFIYQLNTNKLVLEKDYHAAVWIYGTPTTLAGSDTKLYYKVLGVEKGATLSSNIVGRTAGDWTLMYLPIKGSDIVENTSLEVGVKNMSSNHIAYVDDFRFSPKGSISNAYVYDRDWGELTHVLNALNLFTRYEYDPMGRLKAVYLEQFGKTPYKVSENEYKYAKPI